MHRKTEYSNFSLQKRLLAVVGTVAFLFLALFGKLFVVQIYQGEKLQMRAVSQWTRDLSLSGLRGDIVDTRGDILATSYTSYNVYVRGSNVVDAEEVARVLSEVLGVDYEKTLAKAKDRSVSERLIAQQVDYAEAHMLLSYNLGGIYLSETSTRQYLYDELLCNVLGFCTTDNIGQSGLEAYYNNFLKGIDGTSYTESDITGLELSNATTSYIPGVEGCQIQLTIDLGIQRILEGIVQTAQVEQQAKSTTAIIMNPQNGEIVAMASSPGFDLNNPPREDVSNLMSLSKNTMITDVYEPGSTFKLFTLAAALENGVTSLDEKFYDPGFRIVDGQKIKCWKTTGHGSQTLLEGVCNSCNSVFMDLGLRLGKERLYAALEKYGIGTATGVDFYGESGGIMMNLDSIKNVDLARISFGQAIATTPLQMITSVCGILNGTLYQPRFIKSITSPSGVTKTFESVARGRTVSSQTSQQILEIMEQVVSKSDGLYSFVPGYRIGGKTGTAQKYENGVVAAGKYVASFVGCYPVDNPQYVLLLCVDEPTAGAYYGSVVAAPYAKQVFSGIFNYLGIEPTNLTEDLEKMQANIEVPNLVGLSVTEATAMLRARRLQFEIDGEDPFVVWQSIPPGEKVFEGAILVLKT